MKYRRKISYVLKKVKSRILSLNRFLNDFLFRSDHEGKLGATLNIFDGEELLLDLLVSIRKEVDFVSIVFQEVGHWGDLRADSHLRDFLRSLKNLGMIDEVIDWTPKNAASNEYLFHTMDVEKRQAGLKLAQENGCTHFIVLDNDEFYTRKQFRYMKRIMMRSNSKWDYSVLRHLQYYKNTNLIKREREEEYVMGIFRIDQSTEFRYGAESKFPIDPARKIEGESVLEFSRFEVCMHHLSYVRKDIRKKLLASQARTGNQESLNQIISRYESFRYPQRGIWAHGVEIDLKKIRPHIHLKYYEADAYSRYTNGEPLQKLLFELGN